MDPTVEATAPQPPERVEQTDAAVEALLVDLDPEQRLAVLSDGAPLCILAPAGSGKTRVLTRRVARRVLDGSADPSHVLVITFTRRAAGELSRRLRSLGSSAARAGPLGPRTTITAGTFHGLAYRLLRQRWDDLRRPRPDLVTNRQRLVEEVLTQRQRSPLRGVAREVTAEIDWARARMVTPERYTAVAREAGRRTSVAPVQVAEIYGSYEALKRHRRVIDFDDLLALCLEEISRDAAYAAAVRWRFRHLFVDEFQDVNPLQHAVLEAWRGGRDDLCVVGDPDQAIYGWNGADGRWLSDFADHHPRATVVRLRRSHRSTPQIVSLGHAILTGSAEDAPAASRPEGASPRLLQFSDPAAEALGVAHLVRDARLPGGRWRSIAVLSRTNEQLARIATALDSQGVPQRRRTTRPDPALVAALGELRSVTGPGALQAWLDEGLDGLQDDERTPSAAGAPRALVRAAEDLLAQDPDADGPALRVFLSTGGTSEAALGDDAGDEDADAVTLLTFHAAKGLEWPTVVVVGVVPGLVPHAAGRTVEALAEERRLFHVAVTRAERDLVLTWYGDEVSPFLSSSLAAVALATEPAVPPPADLRPGGAPQPPDPVLAALQVWRRDAAHAARVDEVVVLDDDTLAAVAVRRPASVEELAAVRGVSGLMAARHGERMLAVVATASRPDDPPASPPDPPPATARRRPPPAR